MGSFETAKSDSDCDGILNVDEDLNGNGILDPGETDPDLADTDGDGMDDGWEKAHGLDPRLDDADSDPDNDGLTNMEEYDAFTNPNLADSDLDGMPDRYEVDNHLNPLFDDRWEDFDADGINNFREYLGGSDPNDDSEIPETIIFYVDGNAQGQQTGLSWTDACRDLQDAISMACAGDRVLVAAGTYIPSQSLMGDIRRRYAFYLKNNVSITGGFEGNEDPATFNPDNRNPDENETILSGDIEGNDDPGDSATR